MPAETPPSPDRRRAVAMRYRGERDRAPRILAKGQGDTAERIIALAKRYGKPRLEAGCTLALQIGACKYRHVRDILANNRDQSIPTTAGDWISPDHAHVRGPGYYQ